MRASRGMGAIRASKMPNGKTITRKDNPDKVRMFNTGGTNKKPTPREEPSQPLTAEQLRRIQEQLEREQGTTRVPDRLFQGESERDDTTRKPVKKAKGGKANFIQSAIKKPGALRASLGAKPGKPIPAGKLAKAAKAPGKLGQRARFAEMLKGFKKKK